MADRQWTFGNVLGYLYLAFAVYTDADLDEAVDWSIKAIFTNAGQVCLAGSRLYVQKDIYKEFLSRFHIKTKQMVVGDPMDQKTEIGPLSSEEHYKKVVGYLDLKEKEGFTILCGGKGKGWWRKREKGKRRRDV